MTNPAERELIVEYFGLDVHKRYTVFTHVDERGRLLGQGRVSNDAESLSQLIARSAEPAKVVLEAGGIWPVFTDALEDHALEVVLAHPLKTRAIASARIKTDRIDSATLAHLLRTDLVPRSYLAPQSLRETREVLRFRVQLVRLRTAVKNRVHALLAMRGLSSPVSDLFGRAGRRWLAELELPAVPRRAINGYLAILETMNVQIRGVESEIRRRVRESPEARRLWSIPGVGRFGALLILAEIGDVRRFPDARHLISYAGLAPSVHSSGGRTYHGRITKQGSPLLRWILVEAAVAASRREGELRDRYRRVAQRKGPKTARVALARHLLTIVYHVLADGVPYRASAARLAA